MLTQQSLVEIHVLRRGGMGVRAIARELNLSRNTVRRYLCDMDKAPQYPKRPARVSKLDPFKEYLRGRRKRPSRIGFRRRYCFESFSRKVIKVKKVWLSSMCVNSSPNPLSRSSVLKRCQVSNYKWILPPSVEAAIN